MIAALQPAAGGQDSAAAQEVIASIAAVGSEDIDFQGFLHFFRMVRLPSPSPCVHHPVLSAR